MIYSPRAQLEVNHIHEEPKNSLREFIFHMGEVSELWRKTMVSNFYVCNLRNCSVVLKCNNSVGK